MTTEKMLAQRDQVRDLAARLAATAPAAARRGPMELLHGTELNIAPDGTVDWPADFLDGFDICVASVHSHFGHRRPGDDLHDGVIALLHDAQLHEHGPATPCRDQHHGGACPGGRCQASGEAVSSIKRDSTNMRSICAP